MKRLHSVLVAKLMIFKSYLLEQNLDPFHKYKILIYGENQGLKKEFKEIIKSKIKKMKN